MGSLENCSVPACFQKGRHWLAALQELARRALEVLVGDWCVGASLWLLL